MQPFGLIQKLTALFVAAIVMMIVLEAREESGKTQQIIIPMNSVGVDVAEPPQGDYEAEPLAAIRSTSSTASSVVTSPQVSNGHASICMSISANIEAAVTIDEHNRKKTNDGSGSPFCQCQRGFTATGPNVLLNFSFGKWPVLQGWNLFPARCGSSCSCSKVEDHDRADALSECVNSPLARQPWLINGPSFKGRLGNNMFQLAGTLAIVNAFNQTNNGNTHACVNFPNSRMKSLFSAPPQLNTNKYGKFICDKSGAIPDEDMKYKKGSWTFVSEPGFAIYFNATEQLQKKWESLPIQNRTEQCRPHRLGMNFLSGRYYHTYFQSWRYFSRKLTRKLFYFNDTIWEEADAVVRAATGNIPRTAIFIHIRLEDIGDFRRSNQNENGCIRHRDRWVKPSWLAPDEPYYEKAMSYMRGKYKDAKFIVIAQNHSMIIDEKVFRNEDTVILDTSNHTEGLDMAIMKRCNHGILSIGTYSWWGGYLSGGEKGGEVVYYPRSLNPEHWMFDETRFNASDFYPPWWTAIDPKPEETFCTK